MYKWMRRFFTKNTFFLGWSQGRPRAGSNLLECITYKPPLKVVSSNITSANLSPYLWTTGDKFSFASWSPYVDSCDQYHRIGLLCHQLVEFQVYIST